MRRAAWCLAVGPDEGTCDAIRTAAGTHVQVIAMAMSAHRARELVAELDIGVVVIEERTRDSYGVMRALSGSGVAVVWVGRNPPEGVHAVTERLGEDLPAALESALKARAP